MIAIIMWAVTVPGSLSSMILLLVIKHHILWDSCFLLPPPSSCLSLVELIVGFLSSLYMSNEDRHKLHFVVVVVVVVLVQ